MDHDLKTAGDVTLWLWPRIDFTGFWGWPAHFAAGASRDRDGLWLVLMVERDGNRGTSITNASRHAGEAMLATLTGLQEGFDPARARFFEAYENRMRSESGRYDPSTTSIEVGPGIEWPNWRLVLPPDPALPNLRNLSLFLWRAMQARPPA